MKTIGGRKWRETVQVHTCGNGKDTHVCLQIYDNVQHKPFYALQNAVTRLLYNIYLTPPNRIRTVYKLMFRLCYLHKACLHSYRKDTSQVCIHSHLPRLPDYTQRVPDYTH